MGKTNVRAIDSFPYTNIPQDSDRPRHVVVGYGLGLANDTVIVHTKGTDHLWEALVRVLANNRRFINGLSGYEAYRFGYMQAAEHFNNLYADMAEVAA